MRLRTIESFWLIKNGLMHSYSSVNENLKCDIVVVGAGITGALVSHGLQKKGFNVIVVDKKDVAFGSTAATTSMLQYEIDEPLHKLSEIIGPEGANECYRAGVDAIDELKSLVDTEKLDCGFEIKDSLYIAHSEKASKDLKKEFIMRKDIGLKVQWLTLNQIKKKYGFKSYGGILSKSAASVDAYRLTHELFHKNSHRRKNPLRVFDQSPIKKVRETSKKVHIEFESGKQIDCDHIVYCNGFSATEMLKEKVADLFDTYACISEINKKLKPILLKTLIWDTNDPYLYARTTEDGRFLIGGEDSTFRMELLREKIKSFKSSQLIKKLKKISPGIDFVEDFTWAGTFGKTKDGLPYIGKSPEYKRSYFVLGFGGNGITFSAQAMKIIPLMLEGKEPPITHYYRFGR
jgi:glycine/D-amino acid oxidase-like deaminating enzyme